MGNILKYVRGFAASAVALVMVLVIALAALVTDAGRAEAHPHVFVKVKTLLVVKDGALTGLKQTWLFDEIWLGNQLLEHDKDGDGRLSRAELAKLEAESKATLEMFRSFTLVRAGGAMVRVVNPRDVVIDYVGPVLGMTFNVSLAKPVPLSGDVLLEVYDATYFSSFTLDGEGAVAFDGGAVAALAGCTVKPDAPASPQQMAAYRMIKKQMGPEWVDKGWADTGGVPRSALISCTKGGGPVGAGDAVGLHTPVVAR